MDINLIKGVFMQRFFMSLLALFICASPTFGQLYYGPFTANGSNLPPGAVTASYTKGFSAVTASVTGQLTGQRISLSNGINAVTGNFSGDVTFDTDTMFVDAASNEVGIGTTTPANKLDVEGAVAIGATYSGTSTAPTNGLIVEGRTCIGTTTGRTIEGLTNIVNVEGADSTMRVISFVNNTANTVAPVFYFGKSRGATVGSNTIISSGDSIGFLNFTGADGVGLIPAASIRGFSDGTPGINDMPGALSFSTTADGAASTTERIRITSAGLVGIGTTNPGQALTIGGTGTVRIAGAVSGTGTAAIIDSNGDIRPLTSSRRFKEDISTLNVSTKVLDSFRAVQYSYKESGMRDFGLIAEEVAEVYPLMVNYDNEYAPYSVKYSQLSVLLLVRIQEINKKLLELEQKISVLGE